MDKAVHFEQLKDNISANQTDYKKIEDDWRRVNDDMWRLWK